MITTKLYPPIFALLLLLVQQLPAQTNPKIDKQKLFENCYWQSNSEQKSPYTLVINWFNYPLVRVNFERKEGLTVENQHLQNRYNKLFFEKDSLSYLQTYPRSTSQYLRIKLQQGGKTMYIYGVEKLLEWRQFSECWGRNTDCVNVLPTLNFGQQSWYIDDNNIPLLLIQSPQAQAYQLPVSSFFDPAQSYMQEYADFSHRSPNGHWRSAQPTTAFFSPYLDGQNLLFAKQNARLESPFEHWGGVDELQLFSPSQSYCQPAQNQHNNWLQWLDKSQTVDISQQSKRAAADYGISSVGLQEHLLALSAQRAADGQLIGRYWDSKGRLFVLQSTDEGQTWKAIYQQTDSLWQLSGRKLRIHQQNELLIPTINGFLYGRYERQRWQFEQIEARLLDLLPAYASQARWLGVEWEGKDKIRALFRYQVKRGMSGDEYQFGSLISNEGGKGWQPILEKLPAIRSFYYQPAQKTWLLAAENYLMIQTPAQSQWQYYPLRNRHQIFINDSSYLEINRLMDRRLRLDSLEKLYQFDNIQRLVNTPLSHDFLTTKYNPLAERIWAAGMDSAGTIYALTGGGAEQVSTVHLRNKAYRDSPKLLFLQVVGKNQSPLAQARVQINQHILPDTMLYDSSSRQWQPWYYLDLEKQANSRDYGQPKFATFWADSFRISAQGYKTAQQANSPRLQWTFSTSVGDGRLVLPLANNQQRVYLYSDDTELYLAGSYQFPIKRYLSNEIVLVSSSPSLKPQVVQLCKDFSLRIDSSQARNLGEIRPIIEWGNRRHCPIYYYYLYKSDSSNFGLLESAELAALRDSSLGLAAVGNRLELDFNPYDNRAQQLGLPMGVPLHPNDNSISINTSADSSQNARILAAAEQLGFVLTAQRNGHTLLLKGQKNWTYKMLIQQTEKLSQSAAWGNSQVYMGQAVSLCVGWD